MHALSKSWISFRGCKRLWTGSVCLLLGFSSFQTHWHPLQAWSATDEILQHNCFMPTGYIQGSQWAHPRHLTKYTRCISYSYWWARFWQRGIHFNLVNHAAEQCTALSQYLGLQPLPNDASIHVRKEQIARFLGVMLVGYMQNVVRNSVTNNLHSVWKPKRKLATNFTGCTFYLHVVTSQIFAQY